MEKDGEDRLVDYYDVNFGGLGHCLLYKASHHGSNTSGNEKIVNAISPEYVCISAGAWSSETGELAPYKYVEQDFINRIAYYTDQVFVTTLIKDFFNGKYEPLNGDIMFRFRDSDVDIICSGTNSVLKDTEWFKKYRKMPLAWESKAWFCH